MTGVSPFRLDVGSLSSLLRRAWTNPGSACSSWYIPSRVTPSEPLIARNVPHSCTISPRPDVVALTASVAVTTTIRHPATSSFLIVPSTAGTVAPPRQPESPFSVVGIIQILVADRLLRRLGHERDFHVIRGIEVTHGRLMQCLTRQRGNLSRLVHRRTDVRRIAVVVASSDLIEDVAVVLAVLLELPQQGGLDPGHLSRREHRLPDRSDLVEDTLYESRRARRIARPRNPETELTRGKLLRDRIHADAVRAAKLLPDAVEQPRFQHHRHRTQRHHIGVAVDEWPREDDCHLTLRGNALLDRLLHDAARGGDPEVTPALPGTRRR